MNYYPLTTNTLTKNDKNLAISVIKSGKITRGIYNKKVEDYFKNKFDRYALLVNSGSSANLLAVALLVNKLGKYKFKQNDEVIIPTLCWSTSLYPIIQMGLKPVFVDIGLKTLNIDITELEKKISNKTKAILLVHALGNCTNMIKLKKIIKKRKIILIEDCCEALGTMYKNKYLGTFGKLSSFSFYFSHHITSGEGGMVLCKDYDDYRILLSLRAHGWSREIDELDKRKGNSFNKLFNFINLGYNLRLTDIQASLLINQMKKIDKFSKIRSFNYDLILKKFSMSKILSKELINIKKSVNYQISWFNFPIILRSFKSKNRDLICADLNKLGVETRPIISGDFTQQVIIKTKYKKFIKDQYPNSLKITESGFMIGLSSSKLKQITINKLTKDFEKVLSKYI